MRTVVEREEYQLLKSELEALKKIISEEQANRIIKEHKALAREPDRTVPSEEFNLHIARMKDPD